MNQAEQQDGAAGARETIALALRAMNEDRDDDAIEALKRGLGFEPRNGVLHYLLGSLYAQRQMIDRATAELTLAAECAPQMHMAHFQLGLLYFTSANAKAAEAAWAPLAALPPEDSLALFRSGLLHLARDEFAACVGELRRGIERNDRNPALNRNMAMVIDKAEEALRGQAASAVEADRHVLLAGYQALKPDGT
jgi:tetratricopeptide (TPR) repeat protein